MTQVARGLDRNGLLLLDMVVNGNVPESLADADLQVQVGGWGWRALGCAGGVGEREWEVLPQCPPPPPLLPQAAEPLSFLAPQQGLGLAWPDLEEDQPPGGGCSGSSFPKSPREPSWLEAERKGPPSPHPQSRTGSLAPWKLVP